MKTKADECEQPKEEKETAEEVVEGEPGGSWIQRKGGYQLRRGAVMYWSGYL